MFWSRCVRSAGQGVSSPHVSLREATNIARRVGCLGGSSASAAPHRSSALWSGLDGPPQRSPVSGVDAQHNSSNSNNSSSNNSSSSGEDAYWGDLQRRQRRLFRQAHTVAKDASIAAATSAVSSVHMEGIVTAVHCGYHGSHCPGASGRVSPGCRTVTVMLPATRAFPVVLLWLKVDAAPASSSCLLAVRCRLSPELVEARWRAQQQRGREGESTTGDASSGVVALDEDEAGEAVTAEKLRCVKAWVAETLLSCRVVVSGQLRMEEVYDGDLDMVVSVPVIELPQDNLMGCVQVLTYSHKSNN